MDWETLAESIKILIEDHPQRRTEMVRKFIHKTWEADAHKTSMEKFSEFCKQYGFTWELNEHNTYSLRMARGV